MNRYVEPERIAIEDGLAQLEDEQWDERWPGPHCDCPECLRDYGLVRWEIGLDTARLQCAAH